MSCLLDIVRGGEHPPIEMNGDASNDRLVMLNVLCCGMFFSIFYSGCPLTPLAGILGNLCPLPLPNALSSLDVNKDLVFPLLQPVISSVSLDSAVREVQDLVARRVVPHMSL